MMESVLNSNQVDMIGTVNSELILNHEAYGEQFYSFTIKIKRLSGEFDEIFCLISGRTVEISNLTLDTQIKITGQYRSYNNFSNSGNKLILAVFIKSIEFIDTNSIDQESEMSYMNSVILNGFVCKAPIYRSTPLGREIADILLAVNRHYNKSDYIPCIAWGRNAKFAGTLTVGTNILVYGRAQSRQYKKHISEDEITYKTAYEISISKLEVVDIN